VETEDVEEDARMDEKEEASIVKENKN